MPTYHSEQLVIPPVSDVYRETFVILHGRGDTGGNFGSQLLRTVLLQYECLPDAFPDAKFIFPTASKRRAKAIKNCTLNQWFNIWSLIELDEYPDIQYKGLPESVEYVCGLLRFAIDEVGPGKVVPWGLSQGSAIMLLTPLHWEGEPFAAAIGMCGWLPLRKQMLQTSIVEPGIGSRFIP